MRFLETLNGTAISVLALTVCLATGCGDDDASPATGGSGAGASGGSGGDAQGGSDAGGAGGAGGNPEPDLMVSIARSEGAGEAPGLIRFTNDSGQVLSFGLQDGIKWAFYGIDPGLMTDFRAAASAELVADVEVGICIEMGTCVQAAFEDITGAPTIEPGKAYTFVVDSGEQDFVGDVVEEATPAPFVSVRPLIEKPGAGSPSLPVELELSFEGAASIAFDDVYDPVFPGPFGYTEGGSLPLTQVRFKNRGGDEFIGTAEATFESGYGYVARVTDEPDPNAWLNVPLFATE